MMTIRQKAKSLLRQTSPGWISMDAMTGLYVYLIMMPAIFLLINMGLGWVQQRVAAAHLNLVSQAAQEYGRSNAATLLTTATATSGQTLTMETLQNAGLLLSVSPVNPWGQAYQIHVRQPVPGSLRLIVLTTGGYTSSKPSFANSVIPATASFAGGHAGFVPSGLLPGQTPGQLQGSFGGWSLDLATANITSPGPGHMGTLTDFSADELASEYLYRVAVPGKLELNEMWTVLDMTDHAIDNAQSVTFEPHTLADLPCSAASEGRVFLDADQGLYVCRKGKPELISDSGNSQPIKMATVMPGGVIDKPTCSPGHTPAIYVAPSIFSAGSTSPPLASVQAWATNESDTQWRVQLRVLRGDGKGWVTPPANYGRVMALAVCE